MTVPDWQRKAQVALDHRDETLSHVSPKLGKLPNPLPLSSQGLPKLLLTEREFELTENYDAIALVDMMKSKKVSSEEVTRAFLRRAAIAQESVNCVTELMWDEAIERAKYLDNLPASAPRGVFHGLPISLKEHLGMTGKTVNGGWVKRIGDASSATPINDILWNAGCVFYVRTTQPQLLMHLECHTNIHGRTVNPWNRNLTCGGSSGGEGALVGMGGSVLGVGGDIGGSVRSPAANNGVYGFKPTTSRIPLNGSAWVMHGNETIHATYGPICRSRETVNLFMETLLAAEPWRIDPGLFPRSWTPYTFSQPLKIAVMWSDGVVKPHPPMIRALKEVSEMCRNAGMEVVEWMPLDHKKAWEITVEAYFPDGGEDAKKDIREVGEPLLPLTEWITTEQKTVKPHTLQELWENNMARDQYRAEHAAYWNATAANGAKEVDVILCPPVPSAAPLHDTCRYWSYTSQWNLVDYPAVVFPVTTVDIDLDPIDEAYVPMNEQDKYNHDLYDPKRYEGAPVSLQIVGRRNFDEKVMKALELVEQAMGRV